MFFRFAGKTILPANLSSIIYTKISQLQSSVFIKELVKNVANEYSFC